MRRHLLAPDRARRVSHAEIEQHGALHRRQRAPLVVQVVRIRHADQHRHQGPPDSASVPRHRLWLRVDQPGGPPERDPDRSAKADDPAHPRPEARRQDAAQPAQEGREGREDQVLSKGTGALRCPRKGRPGQFCQRARGPGVDADVGDYRVHASASAGVLGRREEGSSGGRRRSGAGRFGAKHRLRVPHLPRPLPGSSLD